MPTNPGLDIVALHGLRRAHRSTGALPGRIRDHLDAHDGYVAFSGGKDSTVALHLALQADSNVPVVFFDSGLEFPETYAFIAELAERWNLRITWIRSRQTTLQALQTSGAWNHRGDRATTVPNLHDILISEPAAKAHDRFGAGEIWGVRSEESRGRAALYATALKTEITNRCTHCCNDAAHRQQQQRTRHGGIIRRRNHTVAYGPLWDWKTPDVWAYLASHGIPSNPVYDKLRRLGAPEHFQRISHMLDGNRLEEGRVTWLRRGWPDVYEDLAQLLPRLREFV